MPFHTRPPNLVRTFPMLSYVAVNVKMAVFVTLMIRFCVLVNKNPLAREVLQQNPVSQLS